MGRGACHPCIRLRQETAAPHWSIILSADDGSDTGPDLRCRSAAEPSAAEPSAGGPGFTARFGAPPLPGLGGGAWGSLDSFVSCRADLFLCAVCAVGRRRVTYYSTIIVVRGSLRISFLSYFVSSYSLI